MTMMTQRMIFLALTLACVSSCASTVDARPDEGPDDVGAEEDAGGGLEDTGIGDASADTEVQRTEDTGPTDAGPADTGAPLTYVDDVQPILFATCGECHSPRGSGDVRYDSWFATSYAALENTTSGFNGGCSGDGRQLLLGECVVETARNQRAWGSESTSCNSGHPGQYHRDYSWTCLTPSEVALIEAWAAQGMLER
jgi:mono/diheme cytochrome c family protein